MPGRVALTPTNLQLGFITLYGQLRGFFGYHGRHRVSLATETTGLHILTLPSALGPSRIEAVDTTQGVNPVPGSLQLQAYSACPESPWQYALEFPALTNSVPGVRPTALGL